MRRPQPAPCLTALPVHRAQLFCAPKCGPAGRNSILVHTQRESSAQTVLYSVDQSQKRRTGRAITTAERAAYSVADVPHRHAVFTRSMP